MRNLSVLLCAVLAWTTVATAVPFENASVIAHVPDRVVVTMQPGVKLNVDKSLGVPLTGLAELDAVAVKHGAIEIKLLYGEMIQAFDDPATRELLESVYTVDFPADAGLAAVYADYAKVSLVKEVHPVAVCRQYGSAFHPNDLQTSQWFLRNPSIGGGDIRALGGWAETLGDSTIIVAVTDSGVDWNHPDLGGPHPDRVNGAIWTNWAEYYGTPGVDDDGNGKIDDIRGWDFVDLPPSSCYPDEDCAGQDNDPMDYESHGTNIGGVVSPITDNGVGVAGTAPGCKIMALRVGWLPNGETIGVVRMDFAAQGMVYAAANGAKIVNCSWGSTSFLSSAVQTCLNAGMLIFTAAGNDDNSDASYLGGYSDFYKRVLAVAATNSNDTKASFSNYGTWVDISAPGNQIYTTAYNRFTGQSTYASTQGTSFASPIAAAAAALIWSSNTSLTAAQVSQILRDSCDNIDAVNPSYVGLLGAGRVNLLRALGDNVQQVPGEFLNFQDAMNSAAVGDTIKVLADYAMSETVLMGKNLKYLGGYAPGYVARDPLGTPTVITGNLGNAAVRFTGQVTADCVVDGFKIQGGGGTVFSDIPYAGQYGGGIILNGTSPTLRNLRVTGNTVGGSGTLGLGGGIAMYNSQSVLENVTVDGNTGIYGAGVYVYRGAPTFIDVTIAENTAYTGNLSYTPRGAGLFVLDADVTLQDVAVNDNVAANRGGGVYLGTYDTPPVLTMTGGTVAGNTVSAEGGGVYAGGGTLSLTDVAVTGNAPTGGGFISGGGFYATATTIDLSDVVVAGNTAAFGGGAQFSTCPDVSLSGSVFSGNTGTLLAGALYLLSNSSASLANLTIADNACPNGGAGLYASGTPLTVSNTISAFNTGGTTTANGMYITGAAATLTCNDVFGNSGAGYGGVADPTGSNGNIALDPEFCDRPGGDYRIAATSPCAPEQSGGCGLIGALTAGCGGVPVEDAAVPLVFRVEAAFPNPFNPMTTIRFTTPAAAHTSVVVYDLRGRVVKTLVNGVLPGDTHSVQWHGDNQSGSPASTGVYFYRVTSGLYSATGRVALIK